MTSKDFRTVKTFFRRYRERKEDTELYYASPTLKKKEDKPDTKRWKENHTERERPGGEKISKFRESKGRRATSSSSNNLPSKRVWGMLSLAKGERETVRNGALREENSLLPLKTSIFIWKGKVNLLFKIANQKRQAKTYSII